MCTMGTWHNTEVTCLGGSGHGCMESLPYPARWGGGIGSIWARTVRTRRV